MYIAGSDDDIQGGICWGPIAHAPMPHLQPATWFDGENDRVIIPGCLPLHLPLSFSGRFFVLESPGEYWALAEIGLVDYNTIKIIRNTNNQYIDIYVYRNDLSVWLTRIAGFVWGNSIRHIAVSIIDNGALLILSYWLDGVKGPVSTTPSTLLYNQGSMGNLKVAHYGLGSSPLLFPRGVFLDYSFYQRELADTDIPALLSGGIASGAFGYWVDTPDYWTGVGVPNGTVYGSPERALIRGDGKVILNNIIQNP